MLYVESDSFLVEESPLISKTSGRTAMAFHWSNRWQTEMKIRNSLNQRLTSLQIITFFESEKMSACCPI